MPIVDIKGVGQAQFPDGMSADSIRDVLRKKYAEQRMSGTSDILSPRVDTITPYEPTLTERMGQGVSDALFDSGLVSDRYGAQRVGETLSSIGEFLPGIGDATAGDEFGRAVAEGDKVGMGLGLLGAIPMVGDVAKKGVGKFHGSPFDFDSPNMDNYGAGEGGLGFGFGFHTTDSPRTADNYATSNKLIEIDGERFTGDAVEAELAMSVIDDGYDKTLKNAIKTVNDNPELAFPKKRLELLQALSKKEVKDLRSKGVVYSVSIDKDDIDTYIDFTSSISDQPEKVKALLSQAGMMDDTSISGEDLYYGLADMVGGDKEASEMLESIGIMGAKYQDDIENAYKGVNKGNFNFTTFNPSSLVIKKQ
jgi:hypothetical protein